MKTKLSSVLTLFFLISTFATFTFIPQTAAQYEPYTQWHLPKGAFARFGKGGINEIAYSPDGTRLAVASSMGIWIYDGHTGEELNFLTAPDWWGRDTFYAESVSFSPDGKTVAGGGWIDWVHLWDVATGQLKATLTANTNDGYSAIESVSFSPDGQILAGASPYRVHLWDVATGQHKATPVHTINGNNPVFFSTDGNMLASVNGNGTVSLWNVVTLQSKVTLTAHTENSDDAVNRVSLSPDRQTLASGNNDGTVRLWDVATGRHKATLTAHIGNVSCMSFNPNGQTLASGSNDGTVRLWDVATGVSKTTLTAHMDAVKSVSFSPDGKTLASGSNDGTVRLWDVATGVSKTTLTEHSSGISNISFSPDGKTLASNGWGNALHLWNVATGSQLTTLKPHTDKGYNYVKSSVFSFDGRTLATGSSDGIVRLWDVATGSQLATLIGHTEGIVSLGFSPDNRNLATGGWDDRVRLWDVVTNTLLKTIEIEVGSLSFSPDGRTLATGNWQEINLWDIATGAPLKTFKGNFDYIYSLSFSPDSRMLASGGGDGIVRLWDVATGSQLAILTGHNWDVVSLSFSPDGRTLASSSEWKDDTIRVWDITTGKELKIITGYHGVSGVRFSPNGLALASLPGNDSVLLWELAPAPPQLPEDVNADGIVNIVDLTLVASNFGETGANAADVNSDGVVNIVDLTLVAAAFGNTASAPTALGLDTVGGNSDSRLKTGRDSEIAPTREQVERWLHEARKMNLTDLAFQRGIYVLEQLLAAFTPKQTALLPNYPNPFNPETWIPYQLATPADVSISIYAVDGTVVRTLSLGHQPIGMYHQRSRAAYWDGKNNLGEPVASGLYFYTLTAGDFTATRKMLIRK